MTTVETKDIVQALFNYRKPLDERFTEIIVDGEPIYFYPDPFRVNRSDLTTNGKRSLVRDGGVVCGLTAEEEFALFDMLSERIGFQIRHPYLAEQFEAAYSEAGEEFNRNVQTPYWSRTGQLIAVNNEGYIRKILGIKTKTPDNTTGQMIVRGIHGMPLYRATGIQTPTERGYFTRLLGPLPTDSDISQERSDVKKIGYWSGNNPDDKGVSAVWCKWVSGVERLDAGAYGPLDWLDDGVLGIATEAPLNK